eukprot:jgi/Bigna1/143814/aug1.81_g18522
MAARGLRLLRKFSTHAGPTFSEAVPIPNLNPSIIGPLSKESSVASQSALLLSQISHSSRSFLQPPHLSLDGKWEESSVLNTQANETFVHSFDIKQINSLNIIPAEETSEIELPTSEIEGSSSA